jgi:nicotinamidase-related amidase
VEHSAGLFDLDPRRVAVVLIDFQNDFCSPDVFQGRIATNTRNAAAAVRASRFAAGAHRLGAHVIYTRQVLDLTKLTERQRRSAASDNLCVAGSWGAELFVEPLSGAAVVVKHRYDCWQSAEFVDHLEAHGIEGLVICGVELVCCVLYAVLGAAERGYRYLVPEHLVSGQDTGDETDNRAIRDWLRHNQPDHLVTDENDILERWTSMRS